jgi:DNA-binding PucR family transcriptional regulator
MAISKLDNLSTLRAYIAERQQQRGVSTGQTFTLPTSTSSNVAKERTKVLGTANTAVFQMANLMSQVRTLSRQADHVRPGDSTAVASLQRSVAGSLKQFDEIAKTANIENAKLEPEDKLRSADGSDKPDLDQMRSSLSEMQRALRENMNKVGTSIISAMMYDEGSSRSKPSRWI